MSEPLSRIRQLTLLGFQSFDDRFSLLDALCLVVAWDFGGHLNQNSSRTLCVDWFLMFAFERSSWMRRGEQWIVRVSAAGGARIARPV
jgi:hypothetical protein